MLEQNLYQKINGDLLYKIYRLKKKLNNILLHYVFQIMYHYVTKKALRKTAGLLLINLVLLKLTDL